MIQEIVEILSTLGQKPKSFQQNDLLKNRSRNSKRPEKLDLEKLSIKEFVDQGSMKT